MQVKESMVASGSLGRFTAGGPPGFGGQFVAPTLLPVLDRIALAYREALADPTFHRDFHRLLTDHVGRPTPLLRVAADSPTVAESAHGAEILLKREDLTNTGSSFGGAVLGQCLLALRMGLAEVVADTGSGDHGVALAATAAALGLHATVFIADAAGRSQVAMVDRMRAMGATVSEVRGDDAMLHHSMSGAIQHWMGRAETCLYVAGAPIGPHPYPTMVGRFQGEIGREAREQLLRRSGVLPAAVVATADGGSAAIGLFEAFLSDPVRLVLVEPGGARGAGPAAPFSHGRPGVLHGAYTMVLQDGDGQLRDVSSLAPGTSYPAAAPELAALAASGRVEVVTVDDDDALATMRWAVTRLGVLVSLEAAYALSFARMVAGGLAPDRPVICAVAGGGAKDLQLVGTR